MQMPIVTSRYWNMVHGNKAEDIQKDEEGVQIMRILGKNMAWFLKCKEAGEKAGISAGAGEDQFHELCPIRSDPDEATNSGKRPDCFGGQSGFLRYIYFIQFQ